MGEPSSLPLNRPRTDGPAVIKNTSSLEAQSCSVSLPGPGQKFPLPDPKRVLFALDPMRLPRGLSGLHSWFSLNTNI